MVGSTCSSCHEGEITYKGTTLRIHGGQGTTDITSCTLGAYDALQATIADPVKFARFARRVEGRRNVHEFLQAVKKILTLKLKLFVQERELKGTQSTVDGGYRSWPTAPVRRRPADSRTAWVRAFNESGANAGSGSTPQSVEMPEDRSARVKGGSC